MYESWKYTQVRRSRCGKSGNGDARCCKLLADWAWFAQAGDLYFCRAAQAQCQVAHHGWRTAEFKIGEKKKNATGAHESNYN
jgi:hypothetical protein